MIPILAFEIDQATFNWILSGCASLLATIGLAIWRYGSMFIAWIKPQIEGVFTAHKALVETMNCYVPVVKEQLDTLQSSQEQHGKKLDAHADILDEHGQKLDRILTTIKPSGCKE